MHPVVWIGTFTKILDEKIDRKNPKREKISGILMGILIITVFSIPCLFLIFLKNVHVVVYILVSACILKSTFSIKTLAKYAKRTLTSDINKRRAEVSKLVSRNTKKLDKAHLNSAVIESVAENLTDSVVSPLFYFTFFGVFGAMFYKTVNTMDSMIGYRTRRHRYVGLFAANMDKILNYIPERISAKLIYPRPLKYKDKIPKTVIAMSGTLKVRLEKIGYYSVGNHKLPNDKHVLSAVNIMIFCSIIFVIMCVLITGVLYISGWLDLPQKFINF
jgi:adenosylcobinamide-phosphate synthase